MPTLTPNSWHLQCPFCRGGGQHFRNATLADPLPLARQAAGVAGQGRLDECFSGEIIGVACPVGRGLSPLVESGLVSVGPDLSSVYHHKYTVCRVKIG